MVFDLTETMKEDIEAAGFEEVQEYTIKAPLGRWPADPRLKEIGNWCEFSLSTGLEGWAMQVLTRYLEVCFRQSRQNCMLTLG